MAPPVDTSLSVSVEGPVGRIMLGTPGAIHAVDEPFGRALAAAVERLAGDARVRAVVLESQARVFCAGVRLDLVPELADPEVAAALLESLNAGVLALAELPKPTVAAVAGAAYGGGHNLALACDLTIASPAASFCQAFAGIGLATDVGSLYLLTRRVGTHRAKELALTGRALSAEAALALGAVDEVVAEEELEPRCAELAGELAARAPLAMGAIKEGFARSAAMGFEESLELEMELQARQFASADFQEGARAFLAKRPPRYEGR
ncbi:MAG: enoyl-CoA hydratase/isomerase family protein [Solirubrobacterales bacterium]